MAALHLFKKAHTQYDIAFCDGRKVRFTTTSVADVTCQKCLDMIEEMKKDRTLEKMAKEYGWKLSSEEEERDR